jgi:hypothetical protein
MYVLHKGVIFMMSFGERLSSILNKASESDWTGFIPNVPMNLKIALTILGRNVPSFWELTVEELADRIADFPAIKAQFDLRDDITLAFAIRTLRMQTPAST